MAIRTATADRERDQLADTLRDIATQQSSAWQNLARAAKARLDGTPPCQVDAHPAMTDGRIYTIEDEIDTLQVEIRQAKWKLSTIERAPREGRWCNSVIAWIDAVANQKQRIVVLERELAGLIADQIAQAEGHAS